ncbi:MAG: Protein-disulfide isomerase [Candidatus Gottesmanbacteria bacterium GW2011_GWA2_42_18]|uniref:Protein-disulfide isomerase n=2 Tax=Candidatus Gottesmaniibacteriota TaxID=1752720 RepID=A0A0G1CDI3_9BACT|nr:MAG: Protein-disulfide isomerase [Candidatus Gottesmanbacteria bacterium GW2011_GWA2_42_18]KKS75906.1 MAG: Protein-disulfide isomerase [Candidatus Gottesmanbacteria bacterium GW2011_GWC2_42_8]
MNLTGESKFFIGIILATVAIIIGGVFFMSKPEKLLEKSELIPAGSQIKGNSEASDYLVEFSDFQCPACGAFYPQVKSLVNANKDKLSLSYRHFPLDQHKMAVPAALAAEAAAEQGKFWEMHDYIFENQAGLSEEMLLSAGEKLGLDKAKYEEAYKNKKYQEKVSKDLADGKRFSVNATPTFFLNGKKLNPVNFDDLKRSVEEELKKN